MRRREAVSLCVTPCLCSVVVTPQYDIDQIVSELAVAGTPTLTPPANRHDMNFNLT